MTLRQIHQGTWDRCEPFHAEGKSSASFPPFLTIALRYHTPEVKKGDSHGFSKLLRLKPTTTINDSN